MPLRIAWRLSRSSLERRRLRYSGHAFARRNIAIISRISPMKIIKIDMLRKKYSISRNIKSTIMINM